jgi:hypothetical protein
MFRHVAFSNIFAESDLRFAVSAPRNDHVDNVNGCVMLLR